MKILQLCKKFPYPVKDGETLAITNLSKALVQAGCSVTLMAMNTRKHHFREETIPAALSHYKKVFFTEVDNRLKAKDALRNLFTSDSYHIHRFIDPGFGRLLESVLRKQEFDVVQLETIYLAPYIPIIRKNSKAIIALRTHNVEHEIWERIASNEGRGFRKWYLSLQAKRLKRFESSQLKAADLLIPISPVDADKFRRLGYHEKMVSVPIGMDLNTYKLNGTVYPSFSLSFIGSLDWMPNQEGLFWFLDKVWPSVLQQIPTASLHVAGRNMPERVRKMNRPNVTFYGEVPSAVQFINKHPIMIVPLLSGSGMRAKILEGMALGKTVITTSLGLEGIEAKAEKQVLIANTASEFVRYLKACHANPAYYRSIGIEARNLIKEKYDNLAVAGSLIEAYKSYFVPAIG